VTGLKKFASRLLVGFGMCVAAALPAGAQGTEGTIYDPQIFKYMTVSPEQKVKIENILAQSEKAMVRVFAKYRINPKAKPVFDKLRAASADLQAVESWEKKQMKKVLTKEQYADYLEILQATAANVIKATRDD
jgi:ribonuclease HII